MSLEDVQLPQLSDDPRIHAKGRNSRNDGNNQDNSGENVVKVAKVRGNGRNTESFDPKSTLVRPDMRVYVGPNRPELNKVIKHDDVIIVPEFFCAEDDWNMYYDLVKEMRAAQANKEPNSEWISWHEGAHLISKNPNASQLFQNIQNKIAQYFGITQKSIGTRFNWYRDASDWKPFHHDSAAFNARRAENQNITVGVSFGATRELAFLHAKSGNKIYFPQTNGMLFSFGRDVNIQWKHGINALSDEEQANDQRGRISIVLWGLAKNVKEEDNSPPMLTDNTRGFGHNMHRASKDDGYGNDDHRDHNRGRSDFRDRSRDRNRDRDRDRDRSRDRSRDRNRGVGREKENHRNGNYRRGDSRDRADSRDYDNGYRPGNDRNGDSFNGALSSRR